MIGTLYFASCAVVALAGALTVVVAQSPIRSAVGLLTAILGIAGLFLRLEAQFLAAVQVIVYAGAIVVLFVFVIMLLGPTGGSPPMENRASMMTWVGIAMAVLVAGGAAYLLAPRAPVSPMPAVLVGYGSAEAVGAQLFTRALIPFELATALLIVAVIGAVSVARGQSQVRRPRTPPSAPSERLFGGPVRGMDTTTSLVGKEGRQ